MAQFTLTTSGLKRYGTGLQGDLVSRLTAVLTNDEIRTNINKIINEKMRERDHIPIDTGDLRNSALVNKQGITWRTPYAHYVWAGKVYKPNIPVFSKGVLVRFVSPKGKKKYQSDQPMEYSIGETTGPRWVDIAFEQSGRIINNAVTNYLKKECRRYNV